MTEFVTKNSESFSLKGNLKKKKNANPVTDKSPLRKLCRGETVPQVKGLRLNPRQAGAEPGSPAAATDGAGQPTLRGQREGPFSP